MYAIIETGGKQYTVSPGDEIQIEKIDGGVGDSVTFDKVVAVSDEDGTLHAGNESGGSVAATISGHGRHKKIDVLQVQASQDVPPPDGAPAVLHASSD